MADDAVKVARDKRLDDLVAASKFWTDKRVKELETRVALTKKLLKSRGHTKIPVAVGKTAIDVVVNEVDDFLLTK